MPSSSLSTPFELAGHHLPRQLGPGGQHRFHALREGGLEPVIFGVCGTENSEARVRGERGPRGRMGGWGWNVAARSGGAGRAVRRRGGGGGDDVLRG